jgi:hypothetical protein
LKWETANEINTSTYVVERSINGTDFKQIGAVPAKGNSANSYSYIDHNAANQLSPVLYYRLKVLDVNGSFNYSKVVTVNFNTSSNVVIYPNPIHDVLKIKLSLSRAQNLQINVTDMNGRIVYKKSKLAGAGTGELEINTRNWPSQMYSIKIIGNNREVLALQNLLKL